MAVYEKASGEYPMNAGFYGAPGIADTLAKRSIFIHKIINPSHKVDLRIMQSDGFRWASTPPWEALIVFTIIPIATFDIARIDRLSSSFLLDHIDHFFFRTPDHSLLYPYSRPPALCLIT